MEDDTAAELARLDRVARHLRRCDAFDRDGSAHDTGGRGHVRAVRDHAAASDERMGRRVVWRLLILLLTTTLLATFWSTFH
jgi:hypothetical protein